jgi:hypothetical protein
MTPQPNPVHMHDQALAFIRMDSREIVLDNEISFEILAREFEEYWRLMISSDVARVHNLSTGLIKPIDPIILTIWNKNP